MQSDNKLISIQSVQIIVDTVWINTHPNAPKPHLEMIVETVWINTNPNAPKPHLKNLMSYELQHIMVELRLGHILVVTLKKSHYYINEKQTAQTSKL